jgi:hypothetical protein
MAATSFPPGRLPLLAAGGLTVLPIGLGINAMFRPQSALSIFQFPLPSTPADQRLALGLFRMYGARNFSMGMAAGIMAYHGHAKALGWYMIGSSVVAFVDGVASKEVIGSGEWAHWVFVSVSVGLGAWLLSST